MQSTKPNPKTNFQIEQLLAVVGAIVCLITCLGVWQFIRLEYNPGNQSASLWPLPTLYLLELAVSSVIGAAGAFNDRKIWGAIIWTVVGIFFAFARLGASSIGLFFLPPAFIFAGVAIIWARKQRQRIMVYAGLSLLAGLGQVALMLTAIALL